MGRRFVYTLLGAVTGYLLGAMVGMTAFAAIYGYRSISILEENNRNRWTFVAASASAVVGGLIGWWRSYREPEPGAAGADERVADESAGSESSSDDRPESPSADETDHAAGASTDA